MLDLWTVVRFLHVLGAIIWVGGLLTITVVVLPPVYEVLTAVADRAMLVRRVGLRFATITWTVFIPLQIATGVMLAYAHGVTWGSLLQPGYGRVLATKITLFVAVMAASTVHGFLQRNRRPRYARIASIGALTGSVGIIFLATMLTEGNFG
ncbi:hypothetical protein H7J07_10175 [Mycobacterium koreense]|uniref:Uncharacterized protein n=1 Tax=Mycolicibacillus koreensis TaxID=1069220 RepID=A0A7I7SH19_9MYCO|nr:hypothetical protein [Mycolicibacillus koreensis]MCV7248578.1 hypothetical protein [Mycolicibacillus koreensis]OSC29403.1 hypothetical protein B8W67_17295 [Mycolicibacillus koreensis]BBY55539.1 hypothetical protein MKOR_27900 [Mycolicibacillus koreensis]